MSTDRAALKLEAIRLRVEERLTYAEIVDRIGVSRGNLSLWLASYPLTKDERDARQACRKGTNTNPVLHECDVCRAPYNRRQAGSLLCRRCSKLAWSQNNPASVKLSYSKRDKTKDRERQTTPESRYRKAKREASRRGKVWEISFEDFVRHLEKPCFYCAGGLTNGNGRYGSRLDRRDNSLGYTLVNVLPCCVVCNLIRNRFLSVDETLAAVRAVLASRQGSL
jgi:hypothetical protein